MAGRTGVLVACAVVACMAVTTGVYAQGCLYSVSREMLQENAQIAPDGVCRCPPELKRVVIPTSRAAIPCWGGSLAQEGNSEPPTISDPCCRHRVPVLHGHVLRRHRHRVLRLPSCVQLARWMPHGWYDAPAGVSSSPHPPHTPAPAVCLRQTACTTAAWAIARSRSTRPGAVHRSARLACAFSHVPRDSLCCSCTVCYSKCLQNQKCSSASVEAEAPQEHGEAALTRMVEEFKAADVEAAGP